MDLNVFQRCTFLKVLGKVMLLVVIGFVALSYYCVAVLTCGGILTSSARPAEKLGAAAALVAFSLLVFMLSWSFLSCALTCPGYVPPGWLPCASEMEALVQLERQEALRTRKDVGIPRTRRCRKCRAWKPDRAHHCGVTGRCVLKMDHYCVWVAACVGLLNYKPFLLFLLYTCAACTLACLLLARPCYAFIFDRPEQGPRPALTFVAMVVDFAFALSVLGFLIMHARMAAINATTIEMYEKRRSPQWRYNRGLVNNLREVFGPRLWQWPIPLTFHRAALLAATLEDEASLGHHWSDDPSSEELPALRV